MAGHRRPGHRGYGVRVRIVLIAVLAAGIIACDGSEPVEAPDLVGLTLEEARDQAGDFELEEIDASGQDRSVWSTSNWTVAEQDPEAGTPVERRSTVTVQLVNVRDGPVDEGDEADEESVEDQTDDPADASEDDAGSPSSAQADERELIAQAEQGFEWFTEERVSYEEDPRLWQIQGSVESITGFRVTGSNFLVETGLHPDNPDTEWVAEGLCGVTSSSLHGTEIRRVEVEASNGNRVARCDVLG